MTKKRRTATKSALPICLVFLACLDPTLGGSRKERFWETVDVNDIVTAATRLREDTPRVECERLVRLNLKYIYFNFLATDEFITVPKPEIVADRISKILSLSEELKLRLDEGRRLCDRNAHPAELRLSARRISRSANEIYENFHNFFAEDHVTPYALNFQDASNDRARFEQYMDACERIWGLLHDELDHYFLNPSPGVVQLSSYHGCSISVLTLSIRKLSTILEKSLGD